MPELHNIKDVSIKLRISEITVRRLIKKRAIPFHRIGRKYCFTDGDIMAYLEKASYPIVEDKE